MRTFIIIAIFLSLATVAFFVFGAYATDHLRGSLKQEQIFEVKQNEDVMALAERLERSGTVFSRYTFLWHLYREEKTRKVIAGNYVLSGTLTVPEVVEIITSGKTVSKDIKITFPEGWTVKKMSERLTANRLPGEDFLKLAEKPREEWRTEFDFLTDLPKNASLEGYLFPDTYLFAPDSTAEMIAEVMLRNFGKKLTAEMRAAVGQTEHTLFEIVTLASIIEEEGRTEKDRRMISDIFWKRIRIGQALQSDATVNYVLGTSNLQPTLKDLEAESLYNTYKYRGLPPGPISNPSLISLKAAIFPESNPYYYFLTSLNGNGETIFSTTFEEHVRNRQQHGL